MYLTVLHGHGTSSCPGASGAPTECTARTNDPLSSIARSAGAPIRVMIRIETDHVRRVGDLHPELGDLAAQRAHAERHHVHSAAAHAAVEDLGERLAHLVGRDPVVGRARVLLPLRADERAVLDAGHVAGVRGTVEAVRPQPGIQPGEGPALDEQAGQPLPLGLRAVAPDDVVGPGQRRDLTDPLGQLREGLSRPRNGLRPTLPSLLPRTSSRHATVKIGPNGRG